MKKRVVIKVGTNVLTTEDGALDTEVVQHLVAQLCTVKADGTEVILVSSGAMGAGRGLVVPSAVDEVARKQVLAAVGQVRLMGVYAEAFAAEGAQCAQVLATREDFRDRAHYLNMRTCFENLLRSGVVPVVNENDVVATTELLFTDTDELAGLVASQLNADAVIILTSVEGFLSGDPRRADSRVIPEIDCSGRASYEQYISPSKTAFGRGGMLTKFHIARKLALQGITVYFANGKRTGVLADLVAGKRIGTKFLPRARSSALKRRIAYSDGLTKGAVRVNRCAEELLRSKEKIMSLLPIGVIDVTGDFSKGDTIAIVGETDQKLGFGIARYSAAVARQLMGTKGTRPVVHYDHLFIGI